MKVLSDKKWPGDRDSNPRMLSHQRFSRPPLSTAQPSPDNIIKKSYLVFLPKKLCHESFLLFTLRLFSYLRQQLCLNKIQKNKQANNAKKELYTNPFGGDTQIRTGDQGFAIPCLSHLAMSPKTKL